jgi:hypothetical protein
MTLDGYISGYLMPPLFAHNMDDPRSPLCLFSTGRIGSPEAALTARALGFRSASDYGHWIAMDARKRLTVPFEKQLVELEFDRRTDIYARGVRKLRHLVAKHLG